MSKRMISCGVVALVALSACAPTVPDSAAGVGFGDYDSYQQQREAALATGGGRTYSLPPQRNGAAGSAPMSAMTSDSPVNAMPAPAQITAQPLDGGTVNVPSGLSQPVATGSAATATGGADDIAAETRAALNAAQRNSGQQPLQASPNNPPPEAVGPMGLSRENDFSAVGDLRSIEGDKERMAENRANYQVIQPEALPERTSTGPNIVAYALQTSNPVGQQVFSRGGFNVAARNARNCAKYASPDLAQEDFLSNGGPQRDRMSLDPDGDGYACSWDPRPFRRAGAAARQGG
ncbi:hypothetical protein [Maritimibacter alkaliphilus]|uniref:hypothetical protein n=1 Tax=Maritimibacter alkaliphilus TaxID=404236 RepID=UPI001C989C97|nr:hypothetical protein [Maritimibacter alkaliphilus]MBY6090795.1 hypothetical protein [Maritimibacter alkaliphilus]